MDARPQFWVFNSPGKMMTCYLRDTNKFLRYNTLCTNILECGFPTKGIELIRVSKMSQLRGTSVQTILVGSVRKFAEYMQSYEVRNVNVVGYVVKFRRKTCFQCGAFPLPCCPRACMENEIRTAISSENIQLLQSYIATCRKKLEEVVSVEEEF